jgi:hypothetical protein
VRWARVGICVAPVGCALVTVLCPVARADVAGSVAAQERPLAAYVAGLSSVTVPGGTAAANLRAVPVMSSYETSTRALARDIGVSVALPDGHDLWLFGDTSVFTQNPSGVWIYSDFIDGSTALEGNDVRGQVPHGAELPGGSPSRFIPEPDNVYLPDGSGRPCIKGTATAAYSTRWPTGAAVRPDNTSEILITYVEVCVTEPPGGSASAQTEGWGYLLYNWRVHRIAVGPIDVFKPSTNGAALAPSRAFGWPVYVNGQPTLFSSRCTVQYLSCGSGSVWTATTSTLSNPSSYKPRPMPVAGATRWQPLSISVGKYSNGLRLIETTTIGGNYDVFGTPNIRAPWRLLASGVLPNCVPHRGDFCHAVEGHPELSSPTGLFVSYKDPNVGPGGHMVISAIPVP